MKSFLWSSLLVLSLYSCAFKPAEGLERVKPVSKNFLKNPFFNNSSTDYVYKANIEAFDTTLGGIVVIKKLDEMHHRIVFTTEFGNKLLDFELQNGSFKINHILDEFNRKPLLKVIKRDFKLLLEDISPVRKELINREIVIYQTRDMGRNNFYVFDKKTKALKKIISAKYALKKVDISFTGTNNEVKEIQIRHIGKNLNIFLYLL